jgi:hypothetical protein
MERISLMPPSYCGGKPSNFPWREMDWALDLPGNVYYALWLANPSESDYQLPQGYDLYVVSFNMEQVDVAWLRKQFDVVKNPVIILDDADFYDFRAPENFFFYSFLGYQHQVDQIIKWFPKRIARDVKYKASAICNRVTQSKLLVVTTLLESLSEDQLLIKISDWVEDKNIGNRRVTGNIFLDSITKTFFEKYLGKTYTVDEFDDGRDNFQRINSNPWTRFYTECALHFTNESYHYSFMEDEYGSMIYPGPMICEKTWKPIIAGCAFIPVAQFDTYGKLLRLGFKFDYGLDLSWDRDAKNLSRLESIMRFILSLKNYSISDLLHLTEDSTKHNSNHVWSGDFQKICRSLNEKTIETILNKFG